MELPGGISRGAEKRRSRRARLTLRGRFLLPDGSEHPCETIDVSVNGVAVRGYVMAELGERVVAYLDELGRLEGVVVRRGPDWFAIDCKVSSNRIERLAQKIAAQSGESAELRPSGRPTEKTRSVDLRTEFGQTFAVGLCNEDRFGAKVVAKFKMLPGAHIKVDQYPAVVVREVADGFLIAFDDRAR